MVTRWDPINRVNLGTFGIEGGPITRSVSLAGQNQAVVGNALFGKNYNYNTGIDSGTFSLFGDTTVSTPSQTRLITSGFSSVYLSSTTGANLGALSPALNGIGGTVALTETLGMTFGLSNLVGDIGISFTNFGNFTTSAVTTLTSGGGYSAGRMGTGFVRDSFGFKEANFSVTTGNNVTIYSVYLNPTTYQYVTYGFVSAGGFATNSPVSVLPAHDGMWVVGESSTSSFESRFTKINTLGYIEGSYVTSAVNLPNYRFTASNVVAPEPGTMLALSAGLVAICKRSKRKA